MKYSPRPFERLLTALIAKQTKKLDKLIDKFARDSAMQATRFLPNGYSGEDFYFDDYPTLSKKIDGLVDGLTKDITKAIKTGSATAWGLANQKNDNMLAALFTGLPEKLLPLGMVSKWERANLPALNAFNDRRVNGLNLSERVWNFSKNLKGDLELAIEAGIGQGTSADRLSRLIRDYLKEPERLYRRVRDEKGVLRLSKSASSYHPGQGVYRSSYKNARRLAATETNMAYRTADHDRMGEMDFVLGYEVHLSNNHTCLDSHGVPQPFYDICDELEGKYPKWFIFRGWHPLCRCYVTTILPDQDEMVEYLMSLDENGHSDYHFSGEITEMPPQFNEWLYENEDRILDAKSLPYFLSDNPSVMNGYPDLEAKMDYQNLRNEMTKRQWSEVAKNADMAVIKAREIGDTLQSTAEGIANRFEGAVVTPLNYKSAESIARKSILEGEAPMDLKDLARTTIVVERKDIPKVIEELKGVEGFMRYKPQYADDNLGYTGHIINIKYPNGVIGEIQVNTPAMMYAKMKPEKSLEMLGEELWNKIAEQSKGRPGLGHTYYERWRVLPDTAAAEKNAIEERSKKYYAKFQF